MDIRQFGNLSRYSWGTVEAQLGHKIENSRAQLGHSRVTARAQLGQKITWGTVKAQLGHNRGKTIWGTAGTQLRPVRAQYHPSSLEI